MKYLLDADTLIDYIQDRGNARPRITAMIEQDEEVAVCAITVAEVYSGLSDKRRDIWESWIMTLSYWHIGYDVAVQAGRSRKMASAAGRTLAVTDSLLAALARDKDAVLLTSNIKDYPMKDVRVMSLRRPADGY
jgi:predicted nucleic acid-binding protein